MNEEQARVINTITYRKEIDDKIQYLLSYYTNKHSKAIVVRFDIQYPCMYPSSSNNSDISECMSYVIKKYKRDCLDPCYIWVREQNMSSTPHYHVALFLDGQRVRRYSHVFDTVESAWGRVLGCNVAGCIHHCTDPDDIDSNGIMLRCDDGKYAERKQKVFRILSYLSKSYSKADDNDGIRNFGCTQLNSRKRI